MSEINESLFGDFGEKMTKIKAKYEKNVSKFVELCNKSTKDIIAICERYLKDKCPNSYLLDATRREGSTKTFDIRYSNVNNKWEPYDIIYRIAYYDNLELKINPYGVTIFEQKEHCAGLETHKEDFDTFASIYNVDNEISKMNLKNGKLIQEDKNLLFSDIASKLRYGVVVYIDPCELKDGYSDHDTVKLTTKDVNKIYDIIERGVTVKPYLFPISSMTDEQEKEYRGTFVETGNKVTPLRITKETVEWLDKNMFDRNGLIEKGLALDATGLNIY